jgi:hypothetical protein
LIPQDYEAFAAPIFAAFGTPGPTTKESDVAEAAWAAVSDTSGRVHFPAGQDSVHLSSIRKVGG